MGETVRIRSYVEDRWIDGQGEGARLLNPATEEVLATASTTGIDSHAALAHARAVGGANLRRLGFAGRAQLLRKLGGLVREHRETAATRSPTLNSTSTARAARCSSTPAWEPASETAACLRRARG
jgi:oxepin-CoA hydrolase/3-oxo-5,6-dehydrosuberyl-CoA semialdehyde dehydrogenase